jgi:hypothetical protein
MIISLLSNFLAAWSLVCYCQNSRCGGSDQEQCDEPDVCFAELDFNNKKYLVREYGCFQHPVLFGYNIETCLGEGIVNDYTSMRCCNNISGCNQHLSPQLPLLYVNRTTTTATAATPITASVGPGPGTGMGMGLGCDQNIPHIPM